MWELMMFWTIFSITKVSHVQPNMWLKRQNTKSLKIFTNFAAGSTRKKTICFLFQHEDLVNTTNFDKACRLFVFIDFSDFFGGIIRKPLKIVLGWNFLLFSVISFNWVWIRWRLLNLCSRKSIQYFLKQILAKRLEKYFPF